MGKQPTLAHAIAGVAVAIAITAVSASTLGLTGASADAPTETVVATVPVGDGASGIPQSGTSVIGADGVEYVYVDAPGTTAPREDEEAHERYEHDDDDEHYEDGHEGRGGLVGWLSGGEHDAD